MLKKWWSHSQPNINDIIQQRDNDNDNISHNKRTDSNHMPNLRLMRFIYFTFSTFRFAFHFQPNPSPSPLPSSLTTTIIPFTLIFVVRMRISPNVCLRILLYPSYAHLQFFFTSWHISTTRCVPWWNIRVRCRCINVKRKGEKNELRYGQHSNRHLSLSPTHLNHFVVIQVTFYFDSVNVFSILLLFIGLLRRCFWFCFCFVWMR